MSDLGLHARRDSLAEQVAQAQFDLGGLTYEMAIRDHFRLDVLVRRAAALQELDAELGEVERLLALQESATAGECPACGALHGRAAVFCWQCGHALVAQTPVNGGAQAVAPAAAAPEAIAAPATTPKPTAPKPTAPKPTAPKPTAPKPTAPKPTAPKATAPKATAPRATAPRATTPKPAAPREPRERG